MVERLQPFRVMLLLIGLIPASLWAQNPIVPNQGLNDPHIHIFNDTAYVYASHDKSADNSQFIMENWWVWSSPDLVNWTKRSILKPEDTYIGPGFTGCWATDVGRRNGKYYWYFSERNQQTGVVVGNSPVGPWKDPLGKPLLSEELTPTHEYDMAIFEEAGAYYIIFGVWDYYIAKLNEDMISLAEKPKKITINNPHGPYNQDGKNLEKPTDDKPSAHQYNGKYYLSWGCFYAMSDNLYGPYNYTGTVINEASFAPGYDAPTWPNGFLQGRHGNFFEWHNQWYYTYCDISQGGNRYFRDAFISYVHYKENGEMAPIRVDGVGVGQYDASQGKIEAEDYFNINGFKKIETSNGFAIQTLKEQAWVAYPNVKNLAFANQLNLDLIYTGPGIFLLDIRKDSPTGERIATQKIEKNSAGQQSVTLMANNLNAQENIYINIKRKAGKAVAIDSFSFAEK